MTTCRSLSILVPVVVVLLFASCAVKASQKLAPPSNRNATALSSVTGNASQPTDATTTKHNATHTSTSVSFSRPVSLGPMVKRLAIVALILSVIVAIYFVWKLCGTRRRKARKYGVVKTPGDVEMRPLESDDDDDDDEDVTMFDRKH